MRAIWIAAVAICLSFGVRTTLSQTTDAVEFAEIGDARNFGWETTDTTTLAVTRECKAGKFALEARPQAGAKPYRGINLLRDFDLTGAGPGDAIVFFVKQNFGSGMRIQIFTDKGPFNRSFSATQNGWARIELDLDPAHWENPLNQPWGRIVRTQFYEISFAQTDHYMILDGLSISVAGKSVLLADPMRTIRQWTFPYETAAAWYLGDADTAWAISKTSGQVLGGWNVRTKERYLNALEGRYHLEDRKSLVTGLESADKVIKAQFSQKDQRIELTCANPGVPDLAITKKYWLDGNKLFHRVGITTANKELQFVTYNVQACFTPAYRNGGFYMGGGDGGGPLVPAPQISGWEKVVQYQNTTKGMLLHQPEKGYSFAHMRTRLDDVFVWPYFTGAVSSYVEAMNMMSYTPDGWDMSLGTSRLSTEKETSYTEYFSVFDGDWQKFLQVEYPALPEVKKALAEIPPVPDWVADVKIGAGGDIDRLRQMVKATDEGIITALVCLSGSWADYYVDQGMDGGFGGRITGPELKAWVKKLQALSPRVKVGLYMWSLSTLDNSRIYKAHPDWFRYGNKDGEPLSTFPGFWPNYAELLSIPGCYNALLSQFDLVFNYLGTDFIFLDDPKAVNLIEWKSGEYTRDEQCFRLFLDIKKTAARYGPDKMIFFNNRGNPYGDMNYIEARDEIRANYWRKFAGIAAVTQEFVAATRPNGRIVPLYFHDPTKREYMNKVLALGWVPDLTYCGVVESLPFFRAAYEVGNCGSSPLRYSPDWKRDKNTNVESYSVRRLGDEGRLLSFINHAEARETIPVIIDLDSIGLERAGRVFVWQYTVENALEYNGMATESYARKVYAQTGWQLDRVTQRKLLYAGPYQKQLSFNVDMEPLRLHQFYITTQPAGVYSENGLPSNYLFERKPKVGLTAKADWAKGAVEIQVDCSREEAEIIAFLPAAMQRVESVLLDGKAVTPDWVCEGDDIFPVVKAGKGKHALAFSFGAAAAPAPAAIKSFTASESLTGGALDLPGYDKALVTVEKSGRTLFNRIVSGKSGKLVLPIAPARKEGGEYAVVLRAVAGADGRLLPVKGVRAVLDLSVATPDLGMPPGQPPMMPAERAITPVNRKIKGLEILNAATTITSAAFGEMQPELKPLIVSARPDELILEGGTSRLLMQGQDNAVGAAFAGFEIKELRRVQVKLSNTFHNAFHMRGPGFHVPERPNSRNFAGVIVDYHTPKGYTKRVSLAVGVMNKDYSSIYPDYGKSAEADETRDLGVEFIQVPEKTFALDLTQHAPKDWDGQVWFSVGSDWVCPSRMLTLQILAANDAVAGPFLGGTDPKAFREAYDKPRIITVPRSAGGIILDGIPFEEWWGAAVKTDEFYLYGGEGVPKVKTTAKLMYDDKNLYVAFLCDETSRRKPLIVGGPPWDDDEIEVWIDHGGDGKSFRQVIVNAVNSKLEYGEAGQTPIGATTAAHVTEGQWMVEMAIPFSGMGVPTPKAGDKWRLSLCRFRPAGKDFNAELIVWAPLKAGGFKDLANFGTMVFK